MKNTLLASLILLSFTTLVFGGVTRTVYVDVQEVWWDFLAGTGKNQITGVPIEQDPEGAFFFTQSSDPPRIGSTYLKARYVEYKDRDFTVLKPKDPSLEHTGIIGPIIWAEVGDTVQMVMRNSARFNFSIHPHGVFYSKEAEGAKYPDNALDAGDYIAPGAIYTYSWPVPARAGPGPGDFSSIIWPYHSHVAEIFGSNSGLVGLFVITAKGKAWPDGHPKGVDREFVVLLDLYDENRSFFLGATIAEKLPEQVNNTGLLFDPLFMESNIINTINGYAYGNTVGQGFVMKAGERVRWYVYGMGAERDVHSIYWHGQTLMDKFHRTSGEILIPATNFVLDMIPDNIGTWLLQCHVNEHLAHGMVTKFIVEATPDYYDEDRNFATTQDPFPFNTFDTFTGSEEIVINSGYYLYVPVLSVLLFVVAFM